jgi:hypothetical protein
MEFSGPPRAAAALSPSKELNLLNLLNVKLGGRGEFESALDLIVKEKTLLSVGNEVP